MLSKSGIYAVQALILLAELPRGSYAGTVSIAERIGAPRNYLGKLLQQLTRDGVLGSQKGMGGGFRLARRPEEITLIDIVDPIEPFRRWGSCILGRGNCTEHNPCAIHDRWKPVKESYLKILDETTIADLAARQQAVDEQ